MQLPIMLSGNSRYAAILLDDEAKSAPPTPDLASTRCENGDPVANYGHFGGIVLSEDLGRGSDR